MNLNLARFFKRQPITMEALMAKIEARLRAEAVSQRFDGSLRVDPNKVYISAAEGERALDRLRQWKDSQPSR